MNPLEKAWAILKQASQHDPSGNEYEQFQSGGQMYNYPTTTNNPNQTRLTDFGIELPPTGEQARMFVDEKEQARIDREEAANKGPQALMEYDNEVKRRKGETTFPIPQSWDPAEIARIQAENDATRRALGQRRE